MERYGQIFLWLGVLSLIFANTAKGIIDYAPTIGFFSALIFNVLALIIYTIASIKNR